MLVSTGQEAEAGFQRVQGQPRLQSKTLNPKANPTVPQDTPMQSAFTHSLKTAPGVQHTLLTLVTMTMELGPTQASVHKHKLNPGLQMLPPFDLVKPSTNLWESHSGGTGRFRDNQHWLFLWLKNGKILAPQWGNGNSWLSYHSPRWILKHAFLFLFFFWGGGQVL